MKTSTTLSPGRLGAIVALGLLLSETAPSQQIIGYYPSWRWKSDSLVLPPRSIPYGKLTIINYAFFYPTADGHLEGRNSLGDDLILRGEREPETGVRRPGTALVELAHEHGVKVMLSIGGWEDSYNFPQVAAGDTTRAAFTHACAEAVRSYGFDGIDIDWEFPCLPEHKGRPEDKANYTKLLRATRDTLDAIGRPMLLTAALPADLARAQNFEMDTVAHLLDMLNIMTYDFSGEWDSLSGHNAPLYAPRSDDSLRNVDAAFRLYAGYYGVPASRINLGVPFYGHTFSNCTALYGHHGGADTVHFSGRGCFYSDIVACRDSFTQLWDSQAKVPYLISTTWKTFVSYDNEESVGDKAQYVVDHRACGVIIWEITGDYLPDGTSPLLEVISSKFRKPSETR